MKTAKIEVFKAGVYGDSESRIWSQTEVQEIVDNYDPAYRNAPIILGHNTWSGEEKPAYGWALKFEVNDNGVLVAEVEYNDDLEEMVKKKMYTRVSMELTKKIEMYDRIGGKTGAYALAIAFLGSNQPAVSGLEPVSFTADDAKFAESFEYVPEDLSEEDGNEEHQENDEEHFSTESNEENGTILQTESDDDLENQSEKESFMTEEELKALLEKAEKFDSAQTQLEAIEAENAKFKLELKKKEVASFMAENEKKIAPAIADKVEAFLTKHDEAVCEEFKNIITALPENAIFENMNDEQNENNHIDTDAKFAEQAKADLQATK